MYHDFCLARFGQNHIIRNICILFCSFVSFVGCAPTNNISSFSMLQEFSRSHEKGLVLLAVEKGQRMHILQLKIEGYDAQKKALSANCDVWNRATIYSTKSQESVVQSYLVPPGDYLLQGMKSCPGTLGCGYMFSIVSGQAIGLRFVPNADGDVDVVPLDEKQKASFKSSLPLLTTPIDKAPLQWVRSLPFNAIMCAP